MRPVEARLSPLKKGGTPRFFAAESLEFTAEDPLWSPFSRGTIGDWTFCNRPGAEESSVRGEMKPKLTFRCQKVNKTCDSSSMVRIALGWRDLQGEVGPASRAGHLQECPISRFPRKQESRFTDDAEFPHSRE